MYKDELEDKLWDIKEKLEKEKQDKSKMLAYYNITEEQFENLTPELFDKVRKPVDDFEYKDIKRQLWHDYRVHLQNEYEKLKPKLLKVSDVRKKLLKHKSKLSSSELRFVEGLKGKRKVTHKQEVWLKDIADKVGVTLEGKFQNRLSSKEKLVEASGYKRNPSECEHEDLGSFGYTHGTTVTCPFCGSRAEVW